MIDHKSSDGGVVADTRSNETATDLLAQPSPMVSCSCDVKKTACGVAGVAPSPSEAPPSQEPVGYPEGITLTHHIAHDLKKGRFPERSTISEFLAETHPTPAPSGNTDALRLLAAEDERQSKLHELLETIREQIRLEVSPEHRPDGLFNNIQNAVYAMRGRTMLMNDAAITAALSTPAPAQQAVLTVTYRNWRGEVSTRRIIPKSVRYGSTEWHPEPQWLLLAWDDDKQADREFALKDFGAQQPVDADHFVDANKMVLAVSSLVREADTILQGKISRGLRLEQKDYDRLIRLVTLEIPDLLNGGRDAG